MGESGNHVPASLEPGALSGPLSTWFKRSLSPWSAQAYGIFIILVLTAWLATTMLGRVWYLIWRGTRRSGSSPVGSAGAWHSRRFLLAIGMS